MNVAFSLLLVGIVVSVIGYIIYGISVVLTAGDSFIQPLDDEDDYEGEIIPWWDDKEVR